MITGLDHAQITIPPGREAEARDFYCTVLGLKEIPKPEPLVSRGGFWMTAGTYVIHVGVEDNVDRKNTKAHLAYRVTDLDLWRETLSSLGVDVIDGIAIPGFARFEFRDPFGNRVEFLQTQED